MSSHTQFRSDLFNQIFSNQFGYEPIRKGKNLLRKEDGNYENLNILQIMGYIPYVVEVLENPTKYPKPSFRDVLRLKGTKVTSCSSLRTIYKRIGLIDRVGNKMVKGKNYDRVLTTKWDWFHREGTLVLISGERYPIRTILWVDKQYQQRCTFDEIEYNSIVSDDVWEMLEDSEKSMREVYDKKVQWGRK